MERLLIGIRGLERCTRHNYKSVIAITIAGARIDNQEHNAQIHVVGPLTEYVLVMI